MTTRPTLRQVADAAGVSIGTASNAFNKPGALSPELLGRVRAAAGELGYAGPDPSARRLRTGRAGALGLIFSERLRYQFPDPAALSFFGGLAEAMQDSHLGLLLLPDSRFRAAAATTVHAAAVDGFIIYSAARTDPPLEAALA